MSRDSGSRGDRKVLVVSLRFPPHGGGGVQRVTYFVRHLAELGWEPTVLTGPGGASRALKDSSLVDEVPDGVRVIRTRHLDTRPAFRALRKLRLDGAVRAVTPSFPHMAAGWIPFAYRAGLRALEETGARVLFSSAYPMCSHVVARLLKERTGCGWVADYRDEWSTRDLLHWPTSVHRRAGLRLDRAIVRSADRVVTTSPGLSRKLASRLADDHAEKFVTITNGYSRSDFPASGPGTAVGRTDRFTISYVGSFFPRYDGAAAALLDALDELHAEGAIGTDEVRLRFVGSTRLDPAIATRSRGRIEETGYVRHAEAVREMRGADLLLLVHTETDNIPGKLFEYMASGTPVLAMSEPGPSTEILREARAGTVVGVSDRVGAKRALGEAVARWRAGVPAPPADASVVARFARDETARRLSEVLASVNADRGRGDR